VPKTNPNGDVPWETPRQHVELQIVLNGQASEAVILVVGVKAALTPAGPLTAARGTQLTVPGVALRAPQGPSTLLFDERPVQADVWNDTAVTFTVPKEIPEGDVNLRVSVHGYVTPPVKLTVT
jgi:hypothetical protein